MRLLGLLWLLAAVAVAQVRDAQPVVDTAAPPTIAIANPSNKRQDRWVVVPVPHGAAKSMPDVAAVGPGWLAVRGRALAEHTQLYYVRADLAAGASVETAKWSALTAAMLPRFQLSPWVTDDLSALVPRVVVEVAGVRREIAATNVQLVESSPVVATWLCSASAGGWHVKVWARTWTGQDAVDLRGYVVWSDPSRPEWLLEDVAIDLQLGERMALYFAQRSGYTAVRGGWRLWRGRAPAGFAFPFRGVVLPGPSAVVDATDSGLDEHRRDLLDAAAAAPLVATCRWDDTWLAFGIGAGEKRWRSDPEAFRRYLGVSGSLVDVRPLANALDTGSTGSQPPFGAIKDLASISGDPWRVYELLWSADDYLLRARHYRELDGRAVTRATHPDWETWSGSPEERAGKDLLGKSSTKPWGWDRVGPRSVLVDDQHRGDAYVLATYALTGDEALADDLLDSVAVDEARAYARRGWLDAPRASGRLWQSWAKLAVLAPRGPTLTRIRALAVAELDLRERLHPQGGVVSPAWIIRDDRVLPGRDAWVPWQDALLALGALEQAHAWERLGDVALSARFRAYAERIGRNVVQWGIAESLDRTLWPCTGIAVQPGGAAPPASYYLFPREGAGFAGGPGINLLVGTPGWWEWFAGALVATVVGPDDGVQERAVRAWRQGMVGTSQEAAEWATLPGAPR